MKTGNLGDLVMDSTETEKTIYKIVAIYDDNGCVIKAINYNKNGELVTNNSISLSKLTKVP